MTLEAELFAKSASSPEEFLVCAKLLPAMRQRHSAAFTLLEIPEVIRCDQNTGAHGTIYFRFYEGETFNHRWNEGNGGSQLGTELSSEMVQVLEDLLKVDINSLLSSHPVGNTVRGSAFNVEGWLLKFHERKAQALAMGVAEDDFGQAAELISHGFKSSRHILSNGDFYPRNLIKLPNRIVLTDWGYWTGYRVCFLDYLCNVAAFAFIHMWSNARWQHQFVRGLEGRLGVDLDDLRKSIMIKSFEQAVFWSGCLPVQAAEQIKQFKMALRNEIAGR